MSVIHDSKVHIASSVTLPVSEARHPWRHKIVQLQGLPQDESLLNQLGEEMWELVTVSDMKAFFKMPI